MDRQVHFPELDAAVRDLIYGDYTDRRAIVDVLAEADPETWARIWEQYWEEGLERPQEEDVFSFE